MNNGQKPVVIPSKLSMRVTMVTVKIPFWARFFAMFSGEIILAVQGMVQDVAVIDRPTAHEMFTHSRDAKWLPFQHSSDAAPPQLQGPHLES